MTIKDRLAIKKFMKNEHFYIATGRDYNSFCAFLKLHHLQFDYAILCNGAILIDKTNKILMNHTFARNQLLNVLLNPKLTEKMKYMLFTFSLGNWSHNLGKKERGNVESVLRSLPNHLTQVSIKVDTVDIAKEILIILKEADLSVESSGRYIDILARGVSKKSGIQCLLNRIDVEDYELHVVGDSTNDLTMFELTENSFAILTGSRELIEVASFKVTSVAECIGIIQNR